uniref:Reverse transcriptase domain-containing protein n=1 Tax=Strongyloides papillosus TaxID=174720 RepID=A0A0N5B5K3_STREA
MKETPTCEQLEMMADKTHFCTMVKQKEMIWKVAYPNSTPAERLSWILLRQSEGIVSGFMTYLENKVKELGDADTNDLVEFMNMRAETREKAYGTKVLEFWNMERKKGENTMDFGARLQTLARRVDKIIWEKLVIQKLLIEIDDYTLFLINSTIDETTDLATVLKKILDAEDVTHGREFKKGETKKKELKLTCWFCKESDHKKEECKKWKDAGSPVYNFTTRTWETGQLKICNNDLAAMREIEICGKTKEVFLDSGSTENWMSLENAKNLGVELKPTSGVSACMADGSALKAIAMFDCEVDFKNGKGIQVLRFYVPVKGNDIIIGWRVLKNNCDLFEIGSDNDTSVESSLTADHSENEVLQDCKDEGHETSVMVEREEVLKFIEQCQQKVESIEKRTPISLELRDELSIEDIQLKRDYRRKVKNIFSGGLQAYLDKEERSGMISRVYDIPRIVSPIHIVKKKNADEHAVDDKIPCDFMRVCVDYSELNQFLAKKEVDLIRLESVIDMVSGSEYLSTMDVSAAYKALPLDEHSKELTCFYTPYGIYKAETLPFGLATAPALFVAEIRKSLKMIKSTNFTFYMDDFLFYGPVAQQIQAIKEVTEALTKRGWSWNLEKCEILKPQVHFIGYLISGTEWEIPDEKIKKLLDMTPPKNAKELASLRGKLLYFSRLIPEFGAITSVWDGSKFRWEEDEQKAFETIMSILKRNPK